MRQQKPEVTNLQRSALASVGAALVIGGTATFAAGQLYFHGNQESLIGWVFAPFAVVVGILTMIVAVKMGKKP